MCVNKNEKHSDTYNSYVTRSRERLKSKTIYTYELLEVDAYSKGWYIYST